MADGDATGASDVDLTVRPELEFSAGGLLRPLVNLPKTVEPMPAFFAGRVVLCRHAERLATRESSRRGDLAGR
jgi:hypothetical protein